VVSPTGRRTSLCLATLALGLLLGRAATAADAPIVVILSWDGVRHDYPDWGDFPGLSRIEREGARAERLVPPFPSNTFPSHASMATGTYPDRHGIVANQFWEGDRYFDYSEDASWLLAEPLWVAAERQGVPSAVFFWVASETDWRGRGASRRRAPFDSGIGEREKVEQILSWLDLPEAERPRLVMSWWHGADRVAHSSGLGRNAITTQLGDQDDELVRLLRGIDARGLWPRTTLLVVSDHGMTRGGRALDPEGALDRAGIAARVVRGGGIALVYLDEPWRLPAARQALAPLGVTLYARDEIPSRLRLRHGERTGDLLLVADPPAMFARDGVHNRLLLGLARLIGRSPGMHGYDPSLPDMAGIFLALGRGVPAGSRLEAVHAVDVAPTAASLLGIAPPRQSEGRARLGTAAR
jgi:predicted AlkP superfamily pyrophosphatase or phosphodiesterase